MPLTQQEVNTPRLDPLLKETAPTGSVEYFDFSSLLPDVGYMLVEVSSESAFHMRQTVSATPATAPTTTAESGDATMHLCPAGAHLITVTKALSFLAFAATTEISAARRG